MVKRKTKREEKYELVDKKIISEFINIALVSSKLKRIIVHQKFGIFEKYHPNINLIIHGKIGSTKSILLGQISEKSNCPEAETEVTLPALVGTIDKSTKQILTGFCWECKNSLMLLDEFDFGKRKKDDIRALLQLSEGGKYRRRLGAFSNPLFEQEDDLYYKFKNGSFNIKTRYSLILATMKYPYTSQNQEFQALVSRSIAIPLYPNKKFLKKISDGDAIFQYKDLKLKSDEIEISQEDYEKVRDYVFNSTDDFNLLRIVGNCIKIFAVLGKHREDLYDFVIKWGSKRFYSPKPKTKK